MTGRSLRRSFSLRRYATVLTGAVAGVGLLIFCLILIAIGTLQLVAWIIEPEGHWLCETVKGPEE